MNKVAFPIILFFVGCFSAFSASAQRLNQSDYNALRLLAAAEFLNTDSIPDIQLSAINSVDSLRGMGVILRTSLLPPFERRVVRLELSGRRTAAAPPNPFYVDVYFNGSNLSALEYLDISNNYLGGGAGLQLPVYSMFPSPLRYVDISGNQYTGVDNVECAGSVEVLIADDNQFDKGELDDILAGFPNLKKLSARAAFQPLDTLSFFETPANQLCSVNQPPVGLRYLDLGDNPFLLADSIHPAHITDFFNYLTIVDTVILDNVGLRTLPPPTQTVSISSLQLVGYLSLQDTPQTEYLDLSNNNFREDQPFHLDWMLNGQTARAVRTIHTIKLENSNIKKLAINSLITNNYPPGLISFPLLKHLNIARNKLKFSDLMVIVRMMNLQLNPAGAYGIGHGIRTDSFFYAPQFDTLGTAGVRKRENGQNLILGIDRDWDNIESLDPTQAIASFITNNANTYTFFWKNDSSLTAIDSVNHVVLFQFSAINLPLNIGAPALELRLADTVNTWLNRVRTGAIADYKNSPAGYKLRPYIKDKRLYVRMPMVDTFLNNTFVHGAITNPKFPELTLPIYDKKLVFGACIDAVTGAKVVCQESVVSEDADTATLSTLKNSYGAELIDSCMCGKAYLWAWSDEYQQAELNTNGRTTVTQPSQSRPGLKGTEPNYGLTNTDSNYDSAMPDPVQAYNNASAADKVLISIIDSGTDVDHPRLNRFIRKNTNEQPNGEDNDSNCVPADRLGFNFLENEPVMYDDHGHGTAVAGIAAGLGQPNFAPEQDFINLLPIKYTNANGEGTTYHTTCGVYYSVDYHKNNSTMQANPNSSQVRVINASWGYYGSGDSSNALYKAIKYAGDNNILFVCAAGNDGANLDTFNHYPSNYDLDNILVVTSLDANQSTISAYANRSKTKVDIAALGAYSVLMRPTDNSLDSTTTSQEGTSFATPVVSRAAALLYAHNPNASFCNIKDALMAAATPINGADSASVASGGFMDAAALQRAKSLVDSLAGVNSPCATAILGRNALAGSISAGFVLQPNPTAANLWLRFFQPTEEKTNLSILDLNGNQLYQQQLGAGSYGLELPTQSLQAGVYILQLQNSKGLKAEKFVKIN